MRCHRWGDRAVAALAVLIVAVVQGAVADTPQAAAESTARTWLGLIDTGDYAKSWDAAAKHFRNSISQPQWVSRISAVRAPLGALKSRRLVTARFERSLPGAPDGEYVIVQFSSSFEHKAEATETVTPMREPDGQWRVSGYFIK